MLRFISRCFRRPARGAANDAAFREISELDAYALAERSECPVLGKEECAPQQAAVCLKRMPVGYVLGISDSRHAPKLWYTADLGAARERFSVFVEKMRRSGSPFGNA
jgi:hypothetical protein